MLVRWDTVYFLDGEKKSGKKKRVNNAGKCKRKMKQCP